MTGINQTFRGKVDLNTAGESLFISAETVTDPPNEIELINYTIPVGKKVALLAFTATCRLETKISIYLDSLLLGSGRTGPANLNFNFNYLPNKEVESGNIIVKCAAIAGRPPSDIEAYVQGRLVTI